MSGSSAYFTCTEELSGTNIFNTSSSKKSYYTDSSIFLFRTNPVQSGNNTFKGKIYSSKIYNNNVLVRDFIPVLDPYGVPCMFDKVTNQYFYNAGTGDFIAGPVISE